MAENEDRQVRAMLQGEQYGFRAGWQAAADLVSDAMFARPSGSYEREVLYGVWGDLTNLVARDKALAQWRENISPSAAVSK